MLILILFLFVIMSIVYYIHRVHHLDDDIHFLFQVIIGFITSFYIIIILLVRADYQAEIDNFKYHKKAGNVKLFTVWLIKTQSYNKNLFHDPFIPDEIDELDLIYDKE